MKMFKILPIAVAALLTAGTASAAIVSFSATVNEISAPAAVTNGGPGSNTHILAFNEAQNYLLSADLQTDSGVISSGTRISSHMVFLNRATGNSSLSRSGTVTFSEMILGTMTSLNGSLLALSDYLGSPTTYTNFNNRGLEADDTSTFASDTLSVSLSVTQPGDWIRVITEAPVPVPVPASFALMGLGLASLAGLRRRRKSA